MKKSLDDRLEDFHKRWILCQEAYLRDLRELEREGAKLSDELLDLLKRVSSENLIKMYTAHLQFLIGIQSVIKRLEHHTESFPH